MTKDREEHLFLCFRVVTYRSFTLSVSRLKNPLLYNIFLFNGSRPISKPRQEWRYSLSDQVYKRRWKIETEEIYTLLHKIIKTIEDKTKVNTRIIRWW